MTRHGKILLLTTLAISIFGVIMVYSASYISASQHFNDGMYYAKKQLICLMLGLIGMLCVVKLKNSVLAKIPWLCYIVGVVVLVLVFVPGLSVSSYGATRWLNLGIFSIQPSEIAKFCLIIFLAYFVTKKDITNNFFQLCFALVLGGVYCLLIMLEPNMSITICVGLTMLFVLFVGGARLKFFAYLLIPIVALGVILVLAEPYRIKRIIAFLDPWQNPLTEGYQLIQSLYAISSGGLFGVGLFNSRQAHLFLPFAESDFIFAVVIEELGLFGGAVLLMLFVIMILQIFKIAKRASDRYNAVFCMGIGALIFIQAALNVAVVTGSIPPTGLPMPFVSAGGTSLLVFLSAIGLVLNVDMQDSRNNQSLHTYKYEKSIRSTWRKKTQRKVHSS